MEEKNGETNSLETDAAFKRRIKYAMYALAVIEFIVMAIAVYHKVVR